MNADVSAIALQSLVSVSGLCILVFWLYRDYRVDLFRQRIFTLRDELFDFANSGRIPFDHAAYGLLRGTMNGYIRFGHRISFSQLLVFAAISKRSDFNSNAGFDERLEEALKTLDSATRDELSNYKRKMELLVVDQLVFSSPILMITIIMPLVALLLMRIYVAGLVRALRQPLDRLDSAAMAFGK